MDWPVFLFPEQRRDIILIGFIVINVRVFNIKAIYYIHSQLVFNSIPYVR